MHDVRDRPTSRMSHGLIMSMRELQGHDVMRYQRSTLCSRLGGRRLLLLQTDFHTGGPECQEAAQHSEQAIATVMLPACSVTNSCARVRHPARAYV